MINWQDFPSVETPIDSTNLNNNFKEVFNIIYPVNSVKMFYDNLDHSNFCGFTWERVLKGKVPVGIDSNDDDFNVIGKIGGEKKHTLTENELARHSHSTVDVCSYPGGVPDVKTGYGYEEIQLNRSSYGNNVTYTGDNTPHNNLQPYEVVSYWRRIS